MMKEYPRLETPRLRLRPFSLNDAREVRSMAGDRKVAETTLNIPHPYLDGMAEQWINRHRENWEKGEQLTLAVERREDRRLLGAVGMVISPANERAEMGYWIGVEFWRQGYCTEAAAELLRYGFEELQLNRIYAEHLGNNPASGRVMQKIGMTREGLFRQHVKKWEHFVDIIRYAILREEYMERNQEE
ncbi:MAG: GNAT family N-acetyltransferase [Candidatus Sumerlaeia bacterium]